MTPDEARFRARLGSGRRDAAVDGQRDPGDERRFVREEEQRRVGDLLGPAGAAQRHRTVGALLHQLLGIHSGRRLLVGPGDEHPEHGRVDRPWTDRVHPNLLPRQPQREALDEAHHPELAHRIDRTEAGSDEPGGGGGEEKAPSAAGADLGDGGLGRDQDRPQIEVDGQIEGAHVDALDRGRPGMADVVPDEIQPLEPADRVPHDAARVLVIGEIGRDAVRDTAGRGDLAHDALYSGGVHVHDGDLRPLAREAQSSGPSHARGSGGHDPDLSGHAHRQPSHGRLRSDPTIGKAMKSLEAKAWLALVILAAAMALLLFVPAGTIRYWQAWVYLAIFTGASALTTLYLARHDRALLERRMSGGPTGEKRPAQKLIMWCVSVGFGALLVVPALDHRSGWSTVPPGVVVAADVLILVGFALIVRVYRENTFTSATIEIAENQNVVSTGPYAIVRHPMYASGLLYLAATPLALGSYWGLIPIAAMAPFLIWRLLDEERMLATNLSGYAEYQRRVRY